MLRNACQPLPATYWAKSWSLDEGRVNGVPAKLNTRQELADMRGWLAAEYADINSSLIKVLMIKPEKWKENCHNGEINSDTAAERI